MTDRIRLYEKLEEEMMRLDDRNDDVGADRIRDRLDRLWESLTATERDYLSGRGSLE